MLWAYGTESAATFGTSTMPIAGHRRGAWTESMELAIRMRNLEKLVNEPPAELS